MEKLERRALGRVAFPSKAVMVVCETQEVFHVNVQDLGPVGVGIIGSPDMPQLLGKDVVIVLETLIMYADVVRQVERPNGSWNIGLAARRFTSDVLQYLYDGIQLRSEIKEK